MNCSKCHAPINEGDKFCQTCGSTIPQVTNETPQEVQPEVNNEVTNMENQNMEVVNNNPVAQEQPVNNMNTDQMMNNQPMNNMNQPVDFNNQQPVMNMNAPMNTISQGPVMNGAVPQEPKKNNTVIYILLAVVLVLIAFVVFLLVNSNKDDKEKDNNKDDKTPVVEENNNQENNNNNSNNNDNNDEVIASNYTKSNVNEYTFELPKGYSAGYYGDNVVFYDDDMTDVEGYLTSMNASYSTIDKEMTKASFQSLGIENVTYSERKVNNKNMLIFEGSYQGYDIEVVYVEYSYTKLVAAEVYYKSYANVSSDVYDILGRVEVDESAFSSNSNIRVPNLQLTPSTK